MRSIEGVRGGGVLILVGVLIRTASQKLNTPCNDMLMLRAKLTALVKEDGDKETKNMANE